MSKNGYSLPSRWLHHLALANHFVPESSFDLEKALFAHKLNDSSQSQHIFVSGLARAGTTILMESLYQTENFASLTYRDMPFVLAPNLWGNVTKISKKEQDTQMRAHGDGISIGLDGAEALEEVFWRVFSGHQFILEDKLIPMEADKETLKDFQTYISLILHHYGKSRYLSKNNNNILRLKSIQKAFPKAHILVPFREPLQHAGSLYNQHQRFSKLHESDAFNRHYMKWLGHHEFGGNQRPFRFIDQYSSEYSANELEYWLEMWIQTYGYLLKQYKEGTISPLFINFDFLCDKPREVLKKLSERLDVDSLEDRSSLFKAPRLKSWDVEDSELKEKAEDLYGELCRFWG